MERPTVSDNVRHVFNQYVVRVPASEREALMHHMRQNGVACEIYYPVPLHLQECLGHLGHRPGDFPISEEACRSVLALPMYPEIAPMQQQRVVDVCAAYDQARALVLPRKRSSSASSMCAPRTAGSRRASPRDSPLAG